MTGASRGTLRMPLSVDDLPDVYAPSADWCDRADGNPVDTLNSEN